MKDSEIDFLLKEGIIQGTDNKEFVKEVLKENNFEVE